MSDATSPDLLSEEELRIIRATPSGSSPYGRALSALLSHIAALEAKLAEAQALVARVEKDRAADLVIARELERERLSALAEPVLHYLDWMHAVQSGQTGHEPLAAVGYARTSGELRKDIEAFAAAIRNGYAP